jgi:hypothetical protein
VDETAQAAIAVSRNVQEIASAADSVSHQVVEADQGVRLIAKNARRIAFGEQN